MSVYWKHVATNYALQSKIEGNVFFIKKNIFFFLSIPINCVMGKELLHKMDRLPIKVFSTINKTSQYPYSIITIMKSTIHGNNIKAKKK